MSRIFLRILILYSISTNIDSNIFIYSPFLNNYVN